MNITSLIIYGSCARGSNTSSSDVDLLSITSEGEYKMIVQNKINLALYPRNMALKMAQDGELFMLHIVREGRPLIDFTGDLENLQRSFKFKETYEKEISDATQLGQAIIQFGADIKNQSLVNKRIAWCVRTITIALAAQQRQAIFSATELSEFLNDEAIHELIENKSCTAENPKALRKFENFLRTHSNPQFDPTIRSLYDYRLFFEKKNNMVGMKTVSAFINDTEFDKY